MNYELSAICTSVDTNSMSGELVSTSGDAFCVSCDGSLGGVDNAAFGDFSSSDGACGVFGDFG